MVHLLYNSCSLRSNSQNQLLFSSSFILSFAYEEAPPARRQKGDANLLLLEVFESRPQLPVCLSDMLRNHPDLSENGHVVGVSVPARHNVKMHVIFHPGPRYTSEVQTHIEAFRIHDPLQSINGFSNHKQYIQCLIIGQFSQFRDVPYGCYQKMTVVIREPVHHDHGPGTDIQNEALLVLRTIIPGAENTTFLLLVGKDVGHSPRCPEYLHESTNLSVILKFMPETLGCRMGREYSNLEKKDKP